MNRRKAIAAVLLGVGTTAVTRALTGGSGGTHRTVRVFADERWYTERAEPEQSWQGTLRRRATEEGPGGRPGLTLSLRTGDQDLLIYAAGVEDRLAPFVDARVTIAGKLVDLSGEGFGQELWIGMIRDGNASASP